MSTASRSDAPTPSGHEGGAIRRMLSRLTASQTELEARELLKGAHDAGATPIARCALGQRSSVHGTITSVTLRPRGGVPALEAELYDGSDKLLLVWLGRRRIAGIVPGRRLSAHGRVTFQNGHHVMFNPSYELHQ